MFSLFFAVFAAGTILIECTIAFKFGAGLLLSAAVPMC